MRYTHRTLVESGFLINRQGLGAQDILAAEPVPVNIDVLRRIHRIALDPEELALEGIILQHGSRSHEHQCVGSQPFTRQLPCQHSGHHAALRMAQQRHLCHERQRAGVLQNCAGVGNFGGDGALHDIPLALALRIEVEAQHGVSLPGKLAGDTRHGRHALVRHHTMHHDHHRAPVARSVEAPGQLQHIRQLSVGPVDEARAVACERSYHGTYQARDDKPYALEQAFHVAPISDGSKSAPGSLSGRSSCGAGSQGSACTGP